MNDPTDLEGQSKRNDELGEEDELSDDDNNSNVDDNSGGEEASGEVEHTEVVGTSEEEQDEQAIQKPTEEVTEPRVIEAPAEGAGQKPSTGGTVMGNVDITYIIEKSENEKWLERMRRWLCRESVQELGGEDGLFSKMIRELLEAISEEDIEDAELIWKRARRWKNEVDEKAVDEARRKRFPSEPQAPVASSSSAGSFARSTIGVHAEHENGIQRFIPGDIEEYARQERRVSEQQEVERSDSELARALADEGDYGTGAVMEAPFIGEGKEKKGFFEADTVVMVNDKASGSRFTPLAALSNPESTPSPKHDLVARKSKDLASPPVIERRAVPSHKSKATSGEGISNQTPSGLSRRVMQGSLVARRLDNSVSVIDRKRYKPMEGTGGKLIPLLKKELDPIGPTTNVYMWLREGRQRAASYGFDLDTFFRIAATMVEPHQMEGASDTVNEMIDQGATYDDIATAFTDLVENPMAARVRQTAYNKIVQGASEGTQAYARRFDMVRKGAGKDDLGEEGVAVANHFIASMKDSNMRRLFDMQLFNSGGRSTWDWRYTMTIATAMGITDPTPGATQVAATAAVVDRFQIFGRTRPVT